MRRSGCPPNRGMTGAFQSLNPSAPALHACDEGDTMRYSLAVPLAALALTVGCSGAKYPACEKDEDCKKNAAGAPIDEYCVNQQCQECKENAQCGTGKCDGGRCVASGCA